MSYLLPTKKVKVPGLHTNSIKTRPLTFTHIQQIYSRRLFKKIANLFKKNLYKWELYDKIKLKTLLIIMSNLFVCLNVYKNRLLQRRQKASVCGKGLSKCYCHWKTIWHDLVSIPFFVIITAPSDTADSEYSGESFSTGAVTFRLHVTYSAMCLCLLTISLEQ